MFTKRIILRKLAIQISSLFILIIFTQIHKIINQINVSIQPFLELNIVWNIYKQGQLNTDLKNKLT